MKVLHLAIQITLLISSALFSFPAILISKNTDFNLNNIINSWASGTYGHVSWGGQGSATGAQGAYCLSMPIEKGNIFGVYFCYMKCKD